MSDTVTSVEKHGTQNLTDQAEVSPLPSIGLFFGVAGRGLEVG